MFFFKRNVVRLQMIVLVISLLLLAGCITTLPASPEDDVSALSETTGQAVTQSDVRPEQPAPAEIQEDITIAGYAHPEAIAETDWLAAHLHEPNLRIVDVRWDEQAAYQAEHIPGAVYADLFTDLMTPDGEVSSRIPSPDRFSQTMQRLGISDDTLVVVYDTAGGSGGGARLWWSLRYLGHDNVKLLNGGLTKWKLEGRPTEQGNAVPEPGTFVGTARDEWRATAEQVQQAIGEASFLLIDALPKELYTGEKPREAPMRSGHIATASNLPAPDNLDPVTQALLPKEELTHRWAGLGLKPDQQAIVYCEGGVYSALDVFVLYQLGHEKLSLYEASLMEWGVDPVYPMETGPGM